ncbi:hypothetical protein HN695_03655 [Candidatus Woesearchaeota archaeon]|jgi:Icc-related predicted phosphoesterase|nr:hypothetical protein [Candidatus Woesearchaeota archaeon]MBT5272244.1 hypothetical protein [Candidatus Woesearchaeota archaeon]MBT6041163.1 hypothetical protein [Candidatus Woesearchaeota archaeon]MBT6336516.1 hypothetical protein [Candidatus Woesearchaeota archaeon]MBT7927406.1 hypothetical protein [Candidatus Woesearchaeota archaeon]
MRKLTIILLFLIIFCSSCSDDVLRLGFITDIQGDTINLPYLMEEFNDNNIEHLFVLGDLNDMNNEVPDYDEIYSVLDVMSTNFDGRIFVMPGNHESKEDYFNAIDKFQYRKVSNILNWTYIPFGDVYIIPISGYHLSEYTNPNGFFLDNVEMPFNISIEDCLRNTPYGMKATGKGCSFIYTIKIILSHGPPRFGSLNSIDVASNGENVGNRNLTRTIYDNLIQFGVFGHIHEAGMKAVNRSDELVPENTWSSSLFLNPGPATSWQMNSGELSKGSAAILEIDMVEKKARYEIVRVE